VVRISQVEKPAPGDSELLVKVYATTVNRTDCHYRSGRPWIVRPLVSGLARPRVSVLGNEFAGQVVAGGRGVSPFRAGDRVFGYTEGPFGAHAEYLVIAADGRVAAMPANLGYEQAAPGTEGAHYALSHIRRAQIGSGHNVMVYGATGAIGSAAVQLLKSLGATVTGVCATPHLDVIRQLGADQVIDYTAGDFTRGGPHYDVVFDAAGQSTFAQCKRVLKPRGIYMSTGPGPWYQNLILPLLTPLLGGRKVLFAYPRIDQATVRTFAHLMETGQFTPVIDRNYPLDQIADCPERTVVGARQHR
jgi:NADPH:quinone reductase-like Zn-dependent oxidoreductase